MTKSRKATGIDQIWPELLNTGNYNLSCRQYTIDPRNIAKDIENRISCDDFRTGELRDSFNSHWLTMVPLSPVISKIFSKIMVTDRVGETYINIWNQEFVHLRVWRGSCRNILKQAKELKRLSSWLRKNILVVNTSYFTIKATIWDVGAPWTHHFHRLSKE